LQGNNSNNRINLTVKSVIFFAKSRKKIAPFYVKLCGRYMNKVINMSNPNGYVKFEVLMADFSKRFITPFVEKKLQAR